MKPSRRWFQYSLRSFLALLTALAVWLGVVVNRAREQREAVKAIEALGGVVRYDWEPSFGPDWVTGRPRGRLFDEYWQKVEGVLFDDDTPVQELIPQLKRLPSLRKVYINGRDDGTIASLLRSELPKCGVIHGTE